MPRRTIPSSASPLRKTTARGMAVLSSPLLNKGTAFTMGERCVVLVDSLRRKVPAVTIRGQVTAGRY